MNPKTGRMIQSGGATARKMINNYDSEMIYNPETKKMVKVGGNVGKKVLGGYKQMVGAGSHDDNRKSVLQIVTDGLEFAVGNYNKKPPPPAQK